LALDEVRGRLYVADTTSDAIWEIDTANGAVLGRVAGGGASSVDGPALATSLGGPVRIHFGAGKLWVMDRTTGKSRLRWIDPVAGTVDTFLDNLSSRAKGGPADKAVSCAAATRLTWFDGAGFGAIAPSNVSWASAAVSPAGTVYLSGFFCGQPATAAGASTPSIGVARVEPDGTLVLVAGYPGHGLVDLGAGSVTGFDAPPALDVDLAGNLWLVRAPFVASGGSTASVVGYFAADASGRADPTSLFHVVGHGATQGGEYVNESLIRFQSAWDISVRTQAWVTESNALRLVW
jgi:hypothetical protein